MGAYDIRREGTPIEQTECWALMLRRLLIVFCALAFVFPIRALASEVSHAKFKRSCNGSLSAMANSTHAKLDACVVQPQEVVVETTYYQNASKVGGTALAAYPEMSVRVGAAPHVEAFFDVPSDVAKSGYDGEGIFYVTHPGFGLKEQLFSYGTFAISFSLEARPPLDALAHMTVLPLETAALSSQWLPRASNVSLGMQIGALQFDQRGMGHEQRTAAMFAASMTAPIWTATSVTLQLRSFSKASIGSSAQSSGTVGVTRRLGDDALFHVEAGSAFNAACRSKAHYLGAGFTLRQTQKSPG
jgi:hypothetical protein